MSLLKTIESMPKSLFTNHHRSMPLAKWATLLLGSLILFFLLSSTNNKSLFLLLNGHLSDWFGPSFWGIITCMGDGLFLFPLGMLLVWKNPKKQQAMIISMILAALALNASKHVIDAPRPLKELGSNLVTVVGPQVKNYSMPSGHTGTVFILAGLAIIFSNRKVALAATALAILTGLSRIAVGAHWPADIIAGAWVGLICSVFGVIISTRINAGFLIRSFYIFLGFIPALLLPVYHNGFQNITAVQYLQYALALMSLIIILPEVHSLVRDYKSRRDNNT